MNEKRVPPRNKRLQGLYAITDPLLCGERLIGKVSAAISGGIRILQYRNKHASLAQQRKEALALRSLCREHEVLFIINDNVSLASETDADGVHLGQQDDDLQHAREHLGEDKIIGISCNNRFDLALGAQAEGADYVAFGRFFPSRTKPQAPPADMQLLERARQELHIPVVAIGGITPRNAPALLATGVPMLAVIHGIFAARDVRTAVQDYVRLFTPPS